VTFGVRKPLRSWNPFWANLQVYAYLWFDAVRTKRWRDKLGIWFRRTGWRPADVEARYPKRVSAPEDFHKFDPTLTPGTRRYLVMQYVFVVASVLWIGMQFAAHGASAVIGPCLLLWATLYGIGLMSENREYARKFELARLLVILPTGLYVVLQDPGQGTLLTVSSYLLMSLVMLAAASQPVVSVPAGHQDSSHSA